MNRTMCGAALGVMISATTAFAGIVTAENPPAKPSRGDVHLADFKGFKLEFRWTGRWVWANGRSDNTSSYEWLQNPSARYCYNDGCQMVTHSINGTTDTFTTADGGYFEFTSREGGREMAASYWRGGRRASAGSPPDATATFYSDTAKPAPPPSTPPSSGNLSWEGKWSWARFPGGGRAPQNQRISIELLQNNRVRLCFDTAVPASCGVYPFDSGNAAYTLSRGSDHFEIRLVENDLFGQYWTITEQRSRVTPDGTFLLKKRK